MAATPITPMLPPGRRLAAVNSTSQRGGARRKPGHGLGLRKRRLRIISFFTSIALHFLWWDFILNRPLLKAFRTPWIPRWQRVAVRYKELALDLRGLWVKLGQFLSSRVDVIPVEITHELESLRDEVPPESPEDIIQAIESDFNRPLHQIFGWFSPLPIGSASLAQAHRALDLAGEPVVVKVLRPGIRLTVSADLTLLRRVARWLAWIQPLARGVDIHSMVDEFDAVTTRELDLRIEAQNLERFADDFADDPGVMAPLVHHETSSSGVLTMQDVSFIRIDDVAALERAGIDPKAVARKLYNLYLRQFFVTYRIHADPHPGNLFVRPLPVAGEFAYSPSLDAGFQPGDEVPFAHDRPFAIAVVDFGMVVEIPPRMRAALRDFAIGLGMRDAGRILASYSRIGVLRPGADTARLQEMVEEQLESFWGTFLGQVNMEELTSPAAQAFIERYAGLMRSTPFQFHSELLFMTRAMGILSGVTRSLDPGFDPWRETSPFATGLFQEDITAQVRSSVQDLAAGRLPSGIGSILRLLPRQSAGSGSPTHSTPERDEVIGLRRGVNRLTALIVSGGVLAAGVYLKSTGARVSDILIHLWPGNDLGQWLIDIALVSVPLIFLRRGRK